MIKRILFIALLLAVLLSVFLPQVVQAQTLIDSGSMAGTWVQTHSFYGYGLHWVFYSDGNNIKHRSSDDDGTTWSAEYTDYTAGGTFTATYFSIYFDGTYVHLVYQAYNGNVPVYYKRGLPATDGTISWGTAYNTGITAATGYPVTATIITDTSGYPWLGYQDGYRSYVSKSSTNDGTWSTAVDFPYDLTGNTQYTQTKCQIVALTNGKMAAVYTYRNTAAEIRVKRWTGSAWGATVETTSEAADASSFCAVAQDDDVHIIFWQQGQYDLVYAKWQYSTNTFTTEGDIYAGTISSSRPTITRDTTGNALHVFWNADPTAEHIYYMTGDGSSWSSAYDLLTEVDVLSGFIDCDYTVARDKVGIYYQTNAGVKFKFLGEQFDVDTLEPTGVTDAQATLRGNITGISWGNPTERGFYLNTSQSLTGAAKYSESGTFGTGVFNRIVGGLSPETVYYCTSYATNAETVYGGWFGFITLGEGESPEEEWGNCTYAPEITTKSATYLTPTSAQLNALLNSDGGGNTYIRFQYYTGGGTWTDNETLWISGYNSGEWASATISGLSASTTYNFRAQAQNACGSDDGASLQFTTGDTVGCPSEFLAIPRIDEPTIDLDWRMGTNAPYTMIRYKLGEYPGNSTDGTLLTVVKGNSYNAEDLLFGTTYYFAIWGSSDAGGSSLSATFATAMATTWSPGSTDDPNIPDAPGHWFFTIDYTTQENLPIYSAVNSAIDALEMPRATGWFLGALMLCIAFSFAAYRISEDLGNGTAIVLGIVVFMACVAMATDARLVPGYITILFLIISAGWIAIRRGA
jgi:hypothetical protein